jgi:hypothetical protein
MADFLFSSLRATKRPRRPETEAQPLHLRPALRLHGRLHIVLRPIGP